jgi:hypothetical protein
MTSYDTNVMLDEAIHLYVRKRVPGMLMVNRGKGERGLYMCVCGMVMKDGRDAQREREADAMLVCPDEEGGTEW